MGEPAGADADDVFGSGRLDAVLADVMRDAGASVGLVYLRVPGRACCAWPWCRASPRRSPPLGPHPGRRADPGGRRHARPEPRLAGRPGGDRPPLPAPGDRAAVRLPPRRRPDRRRHRRVGRDRPAVAGLAPAPARRGRARGARRLRPAGGRPAAPGGRAGSGVVPSEPRVVHPARPPEADPVLARSALHFAERLPFGCCALDLDGRLTFLNTAAAELLQAGAAALLGKRPWRC